MLQKNKPDDYVISTNISVTIKKFLNLVSKQLKMKILWKGKGLSEKGYWDKKCIIEIRKKYFRPSEVENLRGNPSKAKKILGWEPKKDLHDLITEMIEHEKNLIKGNLV